MFDVFGGIRSLLKLEQVCIDNNVFRLHYKVTMILLIIFSLLNTSRQYIGDPIDCIVETIPQNIMDTYCWITSTFTLPKRHGTVGHDVPHQGVGPHVEGEDEVRHHKYYQWVCFVFFLQAILFYLPRYIWKTLEGGKARALASDLKMISLDQEAMVGRCKILCDYFQRNLYHHNMYFYKFFFCEIMNLVNVIGQMFLMDKFLGGAFFTYGLEVVEFTEMEYMDRNDPMSIVFPKVTKCTFHKYGPSGTIQKFDGLCVLPVNVINEKMFVFLWFWFIILASITGLALLYRLAVMVSPRLRFLLLRSKFRIAPAEDVEYLCRHFEIGDWFLFYQISQNVDPVAFRKIIVDLSKCLKKRDKCLHAKSNIVIDVFNADDDV